MTVVINELEIQAEEPPAPTNGAAAPEEERSMPRPEDIREIVRYQLERRLRLEAY